jgi:hypothetical protein
VQLWSTGETLGALECHRRRCRPMQTSVGTVELAATLALAINHVCRWGIWLRKPQPCGRFLAEAQSRCRSPKQVQAAAAPVPTMYSDCLFQHD